MVAPEIGPPTTDVVELSGPPAAGASYRRAVRASLRRRSDAVDVALPSTELRLRDVGVDIDKLAAYDRVCGYRLADTLPATYPHVLAFGLALRLMSEPAFPFPVIGIVHIANRITQGRPAHVSERLDFSVRIEGLRPHARGRQFDVVATATVDGAEIWHGVSTYLRRDKIAVAPATDSAEAEPTHRDAPAPPTTAWWRVGSDTGSAYAAVSGDRNPIHVSRIGARAFGFPRPIAHGMWTMARAIAALEGKLADTFTVDVAFRRPLLLPSTVAWQEWRDNDGWTIRIADPTSGRPHLTGSIAPA